MVEPLKSTTGSTGLLVGVGALPVLKVERGLRERVKRVLLLGLLLRHKVIIIIIVLSLLGLFLGLGSGGRGGFGLLLLLGRRRELDSLLRVSGLAESVLQRGLVDDGLEVADDVGELGTERSVEGDTDGAEDDGSEGDVGKGDAFADEEGTGGKVLFKGLE